MEPIGLDGKIDPFSRSNNPRSGFFVDIRQDLNYGANWSRKVNHPIFKVKQAAERFIDLLVIRIFDVSFAIKFHGRPSRP
ncbi:hypothetical protein H5410_056604 [Solanum commersonii]|uniref:Uncharacterized protein n=1 Tax=Solanum commersonii TaxID=4109 RepID=A0A9J5WNJ8_SOLCO|nr:hypothetical protein H5410_056604 [Solanum commersonii]